MESNFRIEKKIKVQKFHSPFVEQLSTSGQNRWVFTDIHGHYHHFRALLEAIKYRGDGQLIFLGDYTDRGPHVEQVISHVKKLQESYGPDKIIALQGNHEDMLCDYYQAEKNEKFPRQILFDSKISSELENHIDWLNQLPFIHTDQDFHYVHGGINPNRDTNNQEKDEVLWLRPTDIPLPQKGPEKPVICGHTPTSLLNSKGTKPNDIHIDQKRNIICLDTGCYFTGVLTTLNVSTGEYWQTVEK